MVTAIVILMAILLCIVLFMLYKEVGMLNLLIGVVFFSPLPLVGHMTGDYLTVGVIYLVVCGFAGYMYMKSQSEDRLEQHSHHSRV